jgi:hypothetical protein
VFVLAGGASVCIGQPSPSSQELELWKQRSRAYEVEQKLRQLELEKLLRTQRYEEARSRATQEIENNYHRFMSDRSFFEGKTISEAIEQAQKKGPEISANEIQKLSMGYGLFRTKYLIEVHNIIRQNSVSSEDMGKLQSYAEDRIIYFEKALFDEVSGVVNAPANYVKALTADKAAQILRSLSPEERSALAFCRLANDVNPACKDILKRIAK